MDVKSASRTLDVFELFAREQRPLTLSEVATALDAPLSSCFNLVRALKGRGFLFGVGPRRQIYPTRKMYDVASAIAASEFVPVLGSIGTGIVYEGDSTPVLAQPILDAQAVHITIAPATVTPGHHAVLSGTVAPKVAGLHVTIEKFFEGTWEPVGATLVESASGTFHTDVSVESEYRAVVADDPGLYEYGYSNGAYLTVKVPAS